MNPALKKRDVRNWALVAGIVGVIALIFVFNIPTREVSARFVAYQTNSGGELRAVFAVNDPKVSCSIGQISRGSPTGWVAIPKPFTIESVRPHRIDLSFPVPDTSDPVRVVIQLRGKRLKDRCEELLQRWIEGEEMRRYSGRVFRVTNDLPSRK